MVNLSEIFPKIIEIDQVIIPMNFKSDYDFLHNPKQFKKKTKAEKDKPKISPKLTTPFYQKFSLTDFFIM